MPDRSLALPAFDSHGVHPSPQRESPWTLTAIASTVHIHTPTGIVTRVEETMLATPLSHVLVVQPQLTQTVTLADVSPQMTPTRQQPQPAWRRVAAAHPERVRSCAPNTRYDAFGPNRGKKVRCKKMESIGMLFVRAKNTIMRERERERDVRRRKSRVRGCS